MSAKILLLQQSESLRRARSLVFGGAYFHSLALKDMNDVSDYLAREPVDVILADCRGAESKGLDLVESLRKEQPKAKVVLVTNSMDLPQVIRSIRLGIKDVFQGALDLRAMAKSVGDLAGRDATGEAIRKADWAPLGEFFNGEGGTPGSPDLSPKAAPPSAGRRAKAGKDDAPEDLSKERMALAEERLRLTEEGKRQKEQIEEIERRRNELAKAESRSRESGATKSSSGAEETLRREREQLRMHVAEVESEMELVRAELAKKEKALAEAEAALIESRMGKPSLPPTHSTAPIPISNPMVEAALKQECEELRAAMASLETERDRAREQVKAKEKALLSATETVQRLQAESARLEEQLRAKESSGATAAQTDEAQRREREQFQLKLAKLESERDFAREQLGSHEASLAAANEAVGRLQVELAKAMQARPTDASVAAAAAVDESARRELEQLRVRMVKLESERDLAREQLSSKEKLLTEANLTVQRLKLEAVQFDQRLRAQESASRPPTAGTDTVSRSELDQALAQLAEVEAERTFAREQLTVKEEALALANQTVESLRLEVTDYVSRLRTSETTRAPFAAGGDETHKAEREQLRARLTRVERERDQAREQLLARERALNEAQESLRRLRMEHEVSAARNGADDSQREAELAAAQKRLAKAQAEVQAAQESLEESWEILRQTQETSDRRKRQLDEQAAAIAHRERLLAAERSAKVNTAGAEEIGASERRLRLLRTELNALASALNEREAGLRAQESRIESLLQKADGDLRAVALQEQHLQLRSDDIQKRIEAAEKRAAEIIASAQARADADDRARAGMSEALQLERESVRKAEQRYIAACHQVNEQLQALADREATMRKREFHLDEREAAIRQVLNRVMSDASAIGRGQMDVRPSEPLPPAETLSDCEDTRVQLEDGKRRFEEKMARLTQLKDEIG